MLAWTVCIGCPVRACSRGRAYPPNRDRVSLSLLEGRRVLSRWAVEVLFRVDIARQLFMCCHELSLFRFRIVTRK